MNKKIREESFKKTNGYCYYCGNDITLNKCHIDHKEPLMRGHGLSEIETKRLNSIDNLVPSCRPCNLRKQTFSVEEFRREISLQIERGRKSSVNFRTAERFGLIKIIDNPVIFYFEELNLA